MAEHKAQPRKWAILAVLAVAVFVVSIDSTILNVALPTLGETLKASTDQLQWMVDAYSLAMAGLLLLSGALSDRFGRKKLLILGLLLFGVASVAAAVSSDAWELIAARAVMGVGASAFMPGTLSILVHVFPEEEREKAIGIWGAVTALGVVFGPLLGGVLLDHFWWGAVYLINVLVVAVSVIGALVLVPESTDPGAHPLDVLSTLLSVAGVTALVYGVIEQPHFGWGSPRVLAGLIGGGVTLVLFFVRQATARHPMVDLRIVRNSRFLGSSGTMAVLMFSLTGILFVLTQELQLRLDFSPLLAGAAILPAAGALMVASPLSAVLSKAIGTRNTVVLALVVFAGGFATLAQFTKDQGYPAIAVAMVLLGAGMGLSQPIVNDVLMSAGPKEQSGLLSSMNDTVQELGAAFGIAVVGSVLAARYTSSYHLTGGAPSASHSLGEAEVAAQGMPTDAAATAVHAAKSAFDSAFSTSALVCAGVALLGAVAAMVLLPARLRTADEEQAAEEAPVEPALVA
ncbi:DHA2 family efflux MFS transporter permease subunit [Streptomyces sp. SP17BM10]|uniref:DHA2 family efflux MFS transporter permease subunit n=1 Tax=Streptomyces sp. SP17BM10 TaxID=3002530 RepID=UPI002E791A0F|nr:DHA2 family efflux MFS transporter permease subunit [Streptomyces sp. SP17BM10]MEE1787704.1 DHA2 family efflux MFS transporter permease subunit [Streptomyces sp. SP17BM10]